MNDFAPEPGNAYVRLIPKYGGLKVPEKTSNIVSYDSILKGEILALHEDDMEKKGYLIGRIGHWRQFKDDLRLDADHAAIELKDIMISSKE